MPKLDRRRAEKRLELVSSHQRHRSDYLDELAYRVWRLRPDHRDPERFHVEKSQIVSELRKLAREAS